MPFLKKDVATQNQTAYAAKTSWDLVAHVLDSGGQENE